MTRREGILAAIAGGVILVGGFALGFVLSRGDTGPTPTPSAAGLTCQVSVSPNTIRVDPDTGDSDDVLSFAGSGFPASSAVSIDFAPEGEVRDYTTTADGDFSAEVSASAGTTHPAPPDIEAGPQSWTVIGWDSPDPPQDTASLPPRACEVEVEVAIELTHPPSGPPSATPPLDLTAGGYAEVVAEGVRVRVEPSLEATVVGALFPGDVVRILAPAQLVDGIAWYRVESVVIQSGQPVRGYVAAGADGQVYLRPTGEPPPPTPTPIPSPTPTPAPG
jgi:hypothetical protein